MSHTIQSFIIKPNSAMQRSGRKRSELSNSELPCFKSNANTPSMWEREGSPKSQLRNRSSCKRRSTTWSTPSERGSQSDPPRVSPYPRTKPEATQNKRSPFPKIKVSARSAPKIVDQSGLQLLTLQTKLHHGSLKGNRTTWAPTWRRQKFLCGRIFKALSV